MKRYGSMEKSIIYVSMLAFVGVVALMVCLGMAAASDDSIVANVETETETIGITLNTKNGFIVNTTLNDKTVLSDTDISGMLTTASLDIKDIISVNLPSVTTIGAVANNGVFFNAKVLTSVNFENLTSIASSDTFQTCQSLKNINMPKLQSISGDNTFNGCTSIETINFPSLTSITGSNIFQSCSILKNVSLSNLTTVTSGNSLFQSCHLLTNVNLPSLETLTSTNTFTSCFELRLINLPNTATLTGGAGNEVFKDCFRLGEGLTTLNIDSSSSNVINTNTVGISQGRTAASYANGVITFG